MNAVRFLAVLLLVSITALPAGAQVLQACGGPTTVTTGGTAVTPITGPLNGYTITNPVTATDQGIGAAEPIYIDPTKAATLTGNGTNAAILPGQSYSGPFVVAGTASATVSVNATTSGHKFTCTRW